jgi:hypothetical protein
VRGGVNHRFALSNPTLVSALSKNSFSRVSLPILACKTFKSTGGSVAVVPQNADSSLAELPFPFRYLIWMNFKPLRQCGQRLVSRHSCQCHFGFEYR